MKSFKPPYHDNASEHEGKTVFLGGSIEMGKAKPWQADMEKTFKKDKVTFFNPLREDWDSSWNQSIEDDNFRTQVLWELDHLLAADIVVFFIQGDTKSPITLMEIGLMALLNKHDINKVLICCEEGFWRRGNVEVMAYKFNIPLYDNIKDLKDALRELIEE